MSRERLFLDTAFIQALLNPNDEYHPQAKQLFPRVRSASEVWLDLEIRPTLFTAVEMAALPPAALL
jgi:hypothetical protein